MEITGTRTTVEKNVVVNIDPKDVLEKLLNKVFSEEKIGRGYFSPYLRQSKDNEFQLEIEEEEHCASHSWLSWESFGEPLTESQLKTFKWAKETWERLTK